MLKTSQPYLPVSQPGESVRVRDQPNLINSPVMAQTCMGGACTHPVVEGVLRAGQAAVVAAVRLRGDHTPCWLVKCSAEGGGGRARRRHLRVHRGGAGLCLLQGEGRVLDPAHIHLFPGSTDIWIRERERANMWIREREHADQRAALAVKVAVVVSVARVPL